MNEDYMNALKNFTKYFVDEPSISHPTNIEMLRLFLILQKDVLEKQSKIITELHERISKLEKESLR